MRWEDEPFVKIYVRDTPEFLGMSLMARCLLHELIRKVDRAGCLKVGKLGIQGIAFAVRASLEEVEPAVLELLREGRLIWHEAPGYFLVPNHIEAQTTPQSDLSRKRREREHARSSIGAMYGEAEPSERGDGEVPRAVTSSHAPSRGVTPGHARSRGAVAPDGRSRAVTSVHVPCGVRDGVEIGGQPRSAPAGASPRRGEEKAQDDQDGDGSDLAQSVSSIARAAASDRVIPTERAPGHVESRTVTRGHVESRAVTSSHEMSPLEENRRERREERDERGFTRAPPHARASLVPIDVDRTLSSEGLAYAQSVGVAEVERVFRDFVNYHVAEAKVAADWEAMWRRWCDRELRIQRRERDRARPRTTPMQVDEPGAARGWELPTIVYPPKKGELS